MDLQRNQIQINDGNTSGSQWPSLLQGLREFDRDEQRQWFQENWTISLYFVGAYVLFIHYGQEYMRNRKPLQLNTVMVIWNSILAIFSITACIRVLPEFFHILTGHQGFYKSVCDSCTEVSDDGMKWGWLFTLSKIAELGDTCFLILRKRKLIFLHWYHHITVLLYCWYSYADHISPARWFICVNYSIHALMYSYYTLRSLKISIPKWIAMTITVLQLSQMVIGVTVNVYAYAMKRAQVDCDVSLYHLHLGLMMYASYFVLFAQFFNKAYVQKDKPKLRTKAVENNNCETNSNLNVSSKLTKRPLKID